MDIPTTFDPAALAHDPLTLLLASACLVVLWLHAAIAKLRDRALFTQHLAAYGVPDLALEGLAWALPLAELALAAGLASPWRAAAAVGSAGLLLLYGAAMAWPLAQGRRPDCGCGGDPLPLSWALVARNAALAGLALLAGGAAGARPLGLADAAAAAAATVLASLLYAGFNQVLRQASRPGALVSSRRSA